MDSEISEIIDRPEGHRLDFKETPKLNDDDGLAKHLVAFANRYGGTLVFGVTDDRQVEGASIDEEDAFATIRTVSRVRCNPPVRFEERFYEQQTGDGRTGDILVVDILPKRSSPHAVTEGENNAKRSYYIRTADESRLITDAEELHHLFTNSADPSFVEGVYAPIVHEIRTYEPLRLRPALGGWKDYRRFFEELTEADREELEDRETIETPDGESVTELNPVSDQVFGSQMIQEAFPLILFHSFRHNYSDYWIRNEVTNDEEYEAYLNYTDTLSHNDLTYENSHSTLSELSIDLDRVFRHRGEVLTVPRGTNAIAKFPERKEDPAKLIFQKGKKLLVEISIHSSNRGSIIGAPLGYPGSTTEDTEVLTRQYDIAISGDFGFPDIEDPQIRLHETFAGGILDFVRDRWDYEEFRNRQPHHEIFRIGEKVDSIDDKLSNFES